MSECRSLSSPSGGVFSCSVTLKLEKRVVLCTSNFLNGSFYSFTGGRLKTSPNTETGFSGFKKIFPVLLLFILSILCEFNNRYNK